MSDSTISLRRHSSESGLEIGVFTPKRPLLENFEYPPSKRARANMIPARIQSERDKGMNVPADTTQEMSTTETHLSSCGTESFIIHSATRRDDGHTPNSLQPQPALGFVDEKAISPSSGPKGMEIRYLLTQDTLPSTKFCYNRASDRRRTPLSNGITPVVLRPTITNLCIEGAEGSPNSSPLAKTILWSSSPASCTKKINTASESTAVPNEGIRHSAGVEDSSNPHPSCSLWHRPLTKEVDWLFRAVPFDNEVDSMRRTRKTVGFLHVKELGGWEILPENVFSKGALESLELFHF
ncbi:hypothetical protein C0992_002960 [Termitomyces sp. T32_za158]|nr:hypothetical protein C0992_002960 [Termitomyces sp. T32_za158]